MKLLKENIGISCKWPEPWWSKPISLYSIGESASRTSICLINRIPSLKLGNKTSFYLLYNIEPTYTHLRVFGFLCFATNSHKSKFDDRATKGAFVGYSHHKKGYEVLDLHTKEIITSKDVMWTLWKPTFLLHIIRC